MGEGGLEYEVPQSRLYCLCINVALCSTALQCICRDTKKFHDNESTHILHNFWTSTHRGEASAPLPPRGATAPDRQPHQLVIIVEGRVTAVDY